jgi:hypothetical protein
MLLEALVVGVGGAVAKGILKTWLHDSHIIAEASTSIVDIFAKVGLDFAASRRLNREFDEIADKVADNLAPFFAAEGAQLDEGDKTAVAIALGDAISRTEIGPATLASQFDLRTERLAAAILQEARPDTRDFSRDAHALLGKSAIETARYITEAAARLPAFTPTAFGEVLDRQRSVLVLVEEVLAELRRVRDIARALNPAEEMAAFEERYRVAISHKYDEVELFGLEAPTKIRRQNLAIAYVTLSMTRKTRRFYVSASASSDSTFRKGRKWFPKNIYTRINIPIADKVFVGHVQSLSASNTIKEVRISDIKDPSLFFDTSQSRFLYYAGHSTSVNVRGPELADSVLYDCPRLLIRGEAGSGKTTLLQWLAVSCASQRLEGQLESWNSAIPILIRLRDYAERPLPAPEQIIRESLPSIGEAMPAHWTQKILSEGRGILLIDGVDELDALKREDVREWTRGLIKMFPDCKYVITSRPIAVDDDWLKKERFEEAELLPMSWSDIDTLIEHWHAALGEQVYSPADRNALAPAAERLKVQLRNNRALRSLATSPLLCAVLCALHYLRQQQLPGNRIALYDSAVRMLLDQRDRARRIGSLNLPQLTEEQKRAFLEHIGYWMLRNGLVTAGKDEVEAEIGKRRPLIQSLPADSTPAKILDLLIERSGIMRSPGEGQVDFVHKTFQEFLSAKAIIDASDLGYLIERAHHDQWHEVVILAAGLAPFQDRNKFLSSLIEKGDTNAQHRHRLYLLAVACLETAVQLSPDVEAALNQRLQQVIPPRSLRDARSLSAAGELAVPLLRRRSSLSARSAGACVRALSLIGGDEAISALASYGTDHRRTVVRELLNAWQSFDAEDYARRVLADSPLDNGNVQLQIAGPTFVGLGFLNNLTGITVQNCRRLRTLEGLSVAKKLRSVNLQQANRIADLTPLRDLQCLEDLQLSAIHLVQSLEPLRAVPDLHTLHLSQGKKITELSPIGALRKLEELTVDDFGAVESTRHLHLPSTLKSAIFRNCVIDNFHILTDCGHLETLHAFSSSNAKETETLSLLTNLTNLRISLPREAKNLDWIQSLISLETLGLVINEYTPDLSVLGDLTTLQRLWISNAKTVSSLNFLSSLTRLRELAISGVSDLQEFPVLSELTDLQVLGLSHETSLQRIDNLPFLGNLQRLDLRGCVNVPRFHTSVTNVQAAVRYYFLRPRCRNLNEI